MRIAAIGFDPPVAMPGGVLPATAAQAALKTSVSPDRRGRGARFQPDPVGPAAAEPEADEVVEPAPEREPLPVYYPPLSQQRSVLDRPAPVRPVPVDQVPDQRVAAPVTEPAVRPASVRTELDETMWRVMGTA